MAHLRVTRCTNVGPQHQSAFEETDEYAEQLHDINVACHARVGYTPRPWQARAALSLHYHHNVLLIAGTGSGKSLAYQALTFLRDGMVLVVTPLNQLMEQQSEFLNAKNITSVALTEKQLEDPSVYTKIASGHYRMIFASPERTLAKEGPLWELITRRDQSFLKQLLYVDVDEAHLVFDWGHSFRPDYANIPALRPYLRKRNVPIVAMTATVNCDKIQRLAKVLEFDGDRCILIRETTNRPNIYYAVVASTIAYTADDHLNQYFLPIHIPHA
jgi:ATP-dependent DNA helicase RecQ